MWRRGWVKVYLNSSMTVALDGGECSVARPGHTLPPGKIRYPFYRRLGRPQGRSGRAENLVPTGIRSRTVQPIVSRYTRPTYNVLEISNNQQCLIGCQFINHHIRVLCMCVSTCLSVHSMPTPRQVSYAVTVTSGRISSWSVNAQRDRFKHSIVHGACGGLFRAVSSNKEAS